jgi:hypothetical protein
MGLFVTLNITLSINGIQNNAFSVIMLSVITLSVAIIEMLCCVVMLNFVMLRVSVFMLNVVILSVMAPNLMLIFVTRCFNCVLHSFPHLNQMGMFHIENSLFVARNWQLILSSKI